MSVDKEVIKKIARLANLYYKEDELDTSARELNQILTYVEKLSKLDTGGINPTFQVSPIENIYRDDIVGKSLDLEHVMSNAPEKEGKFFTVPKIID
ncbi:MAG: Asp-tRNA(Asn)/Glu-tRNA(Gln) amidotransferase subunit GatC [bacterium]|nr:Asp-tRNA(Asn)/Glu-tRNA(Gln) amidotransferase subunit GatC [bacterium]